MSHVAFLHFERRVEHCINTSSLCRVILNVKMIVLVFFEQSNKVESFIRSISILRFRARRRNFTLEIVDLVEAVVNSELAEDKFLQLGK